jgi:hypothetical protein
VILPSGRVTTADLVAALDLPPGARVDAGCRRHFGGARRTHPGDKRRINEASRGSLAGRAWLTTKACRAFGTGAEYLEIAVLTGVAARQG